MLPVKKLVKARNTANRETKISFETHENQDRFLKDKMRLSGLEGTISFKLVTVSRGARYKEICLAMKEFHDPILPVGEQFKIVAKLRAIPVVREHVPPTLRIVDGENGHHPTLFISDLTRGGRYLVARSLDAKFLLDYQETLEKIEGLRGMISQHMLNAPKDCFATQYDPVDLKAVKVWIVDPGNFLVAR